MSVVDPRTRLISFRLSEREYARLQALCVDQGARSLADFVRSCVCSTLESSSLEAVPLAERMGLIPLVNEDRDEAESECCGVEPAASPLHTLRTILLELQSKAASLDRQLRSVAALFGFADPGAFKQLAGVTPQAGRGSSAQTVNAGLGFCPAPPGPRSADANRRTT
jgi:hypothetical protein